MRPVLLAGFLLLILISPASADDFYVNNVTGNDLNTGRSAEATAEGIGPYKSIARALRAARQNDRIILAKTGQPYNESISLQGSRHSGTENQPFTLIGNGAVIEGLQGVPEDAWEHVKGDVFQCRPRLMGHQQLYLEGKPVERVDLRQPKEVDRLQPRQWAWIRGLIYFRVDKGRAPGSYALSYADRRVGITLYDVRHVRIQDVVVQGFQLDGINAHDGVTHTEVLGSISRGNGRSGVSVGGASRLTLTACLIGNNGVAQVRTEGYCKAELNNCDLVESENSIPTIHKMGGKVYVDGQLFDKSP